MATINYLYRSTKEKAPLNLRLLFRHNEKDFVIGGKTRYEVSKLYWNKQHSQKRPKDIEIANQQEKVNSDLNKITNHVLNAFNAAEPETVDKDWLKKQIEAYYNPPKKKNSIPTDLLNYIDYYIDYRKNELKEGATKKYKVVQNKLQRFQNHRKKTILIENVDDSFKNELVDYLKKENYALNTIQRDIVYIKTFCKHARFLGLETSPQLDSLRMDKQKVEKIYLNFEELEKIENLTALPDYLENTKDWLVISCYTGQRISDFMRFKPEMIREEDGKKLLEFTQQKTGKLMTVPLHKKVQEILQKRNGGFPRSISDQRYNDYLKEVCQKAGLSNEISGSKLVEVEPGKFRKQNGTFEKWELVSSHIGRRSFATNFYGKIPTTYLIYITGHSTETMFLNYIGKSNKDLALEVSKYF